MDTGKCLESTELNIKLIVRDAMNLDTNIFYKHGYRDRHYGRNPLYAWVAMATSRKIKLVE
jgi:hypothetical protein